MSARAWMRPCVRPGDLVGVWAPGAAIEAEALERGVAELTDMGFRVQVAESVLARERFAAGSVKQRLRDLQGLLDADVAAIVCTRGGAGSGHLLRHLDPAALFAQPRLLVGYSDVTALHLLWLRHRVAVVHGAMAAHDLAPGRHDPASFLSALAGEGAVHSGLAVLRPGVAEGRLVGGCLSLLAAAAGTPWALPDLGEDVILFVEDVGEPPYRLDRMLLQLRESGALARVRGVVFGAMKGCAAPAGLGWTLPDVLLAALLDVPGPIAFGLRSGHVDGGNLSLPLGDLARLTCAEEGQLEIAAAAQP